MSRITGKSPDVAALPASVHAVRPNEAGRLLRMGTENIQKNTTADPLRLENIEAPAQTPQKEQGSTSGEHRRPTLAAVALIQRTSWRRTRHWKKVKVCSAVAQSAFKRREDV